MALHPRHIISFRQRWKDQSITCFAWPTTELTEVMNVTDTLGDIVYAESNMPNWRYRIAHGLNATTLFQAERSTLEYREGHCLIGKWCAATGAFGWYQYDGDLFQGYAAVWDKPPAASISIDTPTRDAALGRAIQDARSKQSHFRGGNFLAELGDTIRGLRNPAKGFRDLLDVYHRNARKRVKRACGRRSIPVSQHDFRRLEKDAPDVARAAQRALSDTWLEHNYGWAPLLSDAVDAYKALRALSLKTPLARFQGRSSRDDPPTYVSNSRNLEITPMSFTVRTLKRYDVTFYGAVKVEADSPVASRMEEFGVTASNFLPAVWEAIPYSFVVDYFTNVGEIVESVSFPRSDLAWITQTFRNHSIRSTERVAVSDSSPAYPTTNGNKTFSFQAPRVEWDRSYVSRQAFSGSIVPSLRFEIPGSKNWRKWFNLAALARLRTL